MKFLLLDIISVSPLLPVPGISLLHAFMRDLHASMFQNSGGKGTPKL